MDNNKNHFYKGVKQIFFAKACALTEATLESTAKKQHRLLLPTDYTVDYTKLHFGCSRQTKNPEYEISISVYAITFKSWGGSVI